MTATATREIFYLVEQPGRFLFKAGATDDWETASDELAAGPAWRPCIVVRVNDADQLCRLVGRKYNDRLHGDSGWLALMPDQLSFVRSLALKAGDDFQRANPDRPATPPRPRRKAQRPPEPAKAAATEQKAPPTGGSTRKASAEPKQQQPADGPFWGQEQARKAARDAHARADAHWGNTTAQAAPKPEPEPEPEPRPRPEPTPSAKPQPEPAPAARPAGSRAPQWAGTVGTLLFLFGGPLLGVTITIAAAITEQLQQPATAPAQATNPLTTEQALNAIDRARAEVAAGRARVSESQWERLQQEEQREKESAERKLRAEAAAAAQRQAEWKARYKVFGVEDRRPAVQRASTFNPAKSFPVWEQNCAHAGDFIQNATRCTEQKEELMAHAETRAQVLEAEYQECKSYNPSGRDCSKP